MKERIVEDWLTRINERGYQAAFGQILTSNGHKILRIGHSPYEHGKDVLSVTAGNFVHAFQLKDGNIGLKEWERGYAQICALVESAPSHPSLTRNFRYCPALVTNGIFTDPALDRIKQHNEAWSNRGLPELELHDGRWIHSELVRLSSDFWPTDPPDVRAFRALYLVDGRGDYDADAFARLVKTVIGGTRSRPDLERRAAAANLFSSYILGEFYRQGDFWTIFRAWTVTAAAIAAARERTQTQSEQLEQSFQLARDAAGEALGHFSRECRSENAFLPMELEWDEYTRVKNAVAIGAWAVACLLKPSDRENCDACVKTFKTFYEERKLSFWGEGAFSSICSIAWLLEAVDDVETSEKLLMEYLACIASKQHVDGEEPLADPYQSPEEVVKKLAETLLDNTPKRKLAIRSYSLLPLVLLLVRRDKREYLSRLWRKLSRIEMTVFVFDSPADYLEWRCERGTEHDMMFGQPQRYGDLDELATKPPVEKLPDVLRSDRGFCLMFLLGFPHRVPWSIVGSLDHQFLREG